MMGTDGWMEFINHCTIRIPCGISMAERAKILKNMETKALMYKTSIGHTNNLTNVASQGAWCRETQVSFQSF